MQAPFFYAHLKVNSDTKNPLRYFLALCNNALATSFHPLKQGSPPPKMRGTSFEG